MKFEIDIRPETAKFVVDGTPLDVNGIRQDLNLSIDRTGVTLAATFAPEELVYTDLKGITWHVQGDGSMTISGPTEAVKRATEAM